MKFIKDINAMRGLTIKDAVFIDCDGTLVVSFIGWDSILVVSAYAQGEDRPELTVETELSNFDKKEAGLITEEEFKRILNNEAKHREEIRKEGRRKQYEELKKEFKEGQED